MYTVVSYEKVARQMARISKLIRIAVSTSYLRPAIATRTFAAVEHEAVLKFISPKSVIDVGANKGQFSLVARQISSECKIIAFEPLAREAAIYRKNFSGDSSVELINKAASDRTHITEFHVTSRADSSSLLMPGQRQQKIYMVSQRHVQQVETTTIDSVLAQRELKSPVLLKVDVQGGELLALKGATKTLNRIDYIYVECSYIKLYQEQPLADEIVLLLTENDFVLKAVLNLHFHPDEGPIQADLLFARVRTTAVEVGV